MKNKKLVMYVGIILIVLVLIGVGYIIYNNINNNSEEIIFEYTPEQEISEEQLRQTVVTLYFLDPINYKLAPEARQIDSKRLVNDPYEELIKLLIEGPQNESLVKLIPENAKINSAQVKNNILYIDFTKGFIDNQNLGKEQEELILKSIVNTVTELTEINKVSFLIDGEENKGFPDNGVIFDKIFIRN